MIVYGALGKLPAIFCQKILEFKAAVIAKD